MKNFRDFSYSNMKKGLLFRSEALTNISKGDIELLNANNIKTIIDLRVKEERDEEKDTPIDGINNVSISLLNPEYSSQKEPHIVTIKQFKLPDVSDIYRDIVNPKRAGAWSEIFNLLLENNNGAFLFHCSSGKDRTGVVAAIIQSALGLDKEIIYKDYLLTNSNAVNSPDFEKFLSSLDEETKNQFIDYSSAKKEYLDAMFDEVDKVYGSLDNFLLNNCSLNQDRIKKLKAKFLA